MKAPSVGEAAVDLPWLAPAAASLAALARTSGSPPWPEVRSDPGCVLLLARFVGAEPASDPLFSGSFLRDPAPLETALQRIENRPPGSITWDLAGAERVYRSALAHAGLAQTIAGMVPGCSAERAWMGGLLAPLGWLAVCAIDPAQAFACLQDAELPRHPSVVQRRAWGLDHTAIARRLSRCWNLPPWLAAIVGQLGLPVEIAATLGADSAVFQVVQLAVLLNQQRDRGLCLPVGARVADLINSLGISDQAIDSWLVAGVDASTPLQAATGECTLLPDLLRFGIEARRAGGGGLPERLQEEVDRLQEALEEQWATAEERLESRKLAALAELAAGAGHEINNPLAVISGQAQYLLAGEADPQRAAALQAIVRQTHRIHRLLQDLMQFARPPAPHMQPLDLAALVLEVIAALQPLAEERRVQLDVPACADPVLVEGDPEQARTALTCLLRNAIEAAPAEGFAAVRLERDAGENVRVVVEDTGPGPTALACVHLFDPFFSGRSAGRGRGLGLPTAWRLARQQGGDVRFEGRHDGRTRFVLLLPLSRQEIERNGNNGYHVILGERGTLAP